LGNKKDNLAEFNLADFRNSLNRQNKFYAKFSSYTVLYKNHVTETGAVAVRRYLRVVDLATYYHHDQAFKSI